MIRAAVHRRTSVLAAALAATVMLAGCSSAEPDATAPDPTSSASPAGPPAPSTEPSPHAPDAAADEDGPVAAFRTWLTASRAPDTATACAYMTPELAQRMVDQITAQGFPGLTDCASLIGMTASLYAAVGQQADPEVELVSETATEAVLHVAYSATSCGRVVLAPGAEHWVLTERSEEEC